MREVWVHTIRCQQNGIKNEAGTEDTEFTGIGQNESDAKARAGLTYQDYGHGRKIVSRLTKYIKEEPGDNQ